MVFKHTDFTPIDDRILVQPGPEYKVKTLKTELEEKKNYKLTKEGAKLAKPVQKEVELTSELRVGQVLSIGNSINPGVILPFSVGDWVVYNVKQAPLFGLLYTGDDKNCPVLVARYQLLTKVSDESINEFINEQNKLDEKSSTEESSQA